MTSPLLPQNAVVLTAPVVQVTLLEDRAQVQRAGSITLTAGQHKLVVEGLAPVAQDLSLRAEAVGGTVIDARVRRTMAVKPLEHPERAAALEKDIEALSEKLRRAREDQALTETRQSRVREMLDRGFTELPEDVSWGLGQQAQWKDTLEAMFEKSRQLSRQVLELSQGLRRLNEERDALVTQRRAFDRPDTRFVAVIECDVVVKTAGEVKLTFDYTVPNALWRPLHAAKLVQSPKPVFTFESRACVWQNTGEDWVDVRLVFSTARASLGVEPPLLTDDLLSAQKKNDKLVVSAREVVIQKAKVNAPGAAPAPVPQTVELPGVDDGGEIRTLEARGRCTVPSDGRPNTVTLFTFEATPQTRLVAYPELERRVFLTSTQKNEGRSPILAGPVELLLENGFVGWTKVLFVAPGEAFTLSFGPDDAVRLARADRERQQEPTVEKWKVTTSTVWLYLSNLGDTAKQIEVIERMPVSELAEVKVELGAKRTSPKPKVDENGFATWVVQLEPHGQTQVTFAYDVSAAPGVQGL